MEIVMTRTAEGRSTTLVRRDDGVALELPSYAPLHRLPDDLAHFVVERTLGLPWGVLGLHRRWCRIRRRGGSSAEADRARSGAVTTGHEKRQFAGHRGRGSRRQRGRDLPAPA